MSESDDTDTLLLVSPTQFNVPSEPDGNLETSVVEDLLNHVEHLETRVHVIENRTSLLGNELGHINSQNGTLTPNSVESSSEPTVRTVISPRTNKKNLLREVDRYLDSINLAGDNSFETAVTTYQGKVMSALESSGNDEPAHLGLPDVAKLLKEMEMTQNEIEKKLRVREQEYSVGDFSTRNDTPVTRSSVADRYVNERLPYRSDRNSRDREDGTVNNDLISRSRGFTVGDNIGSVPDLGFGVRELYLSRGSPQKKSDDPPRPFGADIEEPISRRDAYLVGSSRAGDDSRRNSSSSLALARSPAKTYLQRTPPILDLRKQKDASPRRKLPFNEDTQHFRGSTYTFGADAAGDQPLNPTTVNNGGSGDGLPGSPQRFRREVPFQPKPLNSDFRKNLLSLADLWKTDDQPKGMENVSTLRQKLEEEKLRRMHLEETITNLNKRVLEEQEKLAVAMVVDEGKDKAILQITEAWKQMVEHWKRIEADRHAMSQKIISEKSSLKRAREDVDKKIERWEKEVAQALDLAAGYKNKFEFLESELAVSKEVFEGNINELREQLSVKEKTVSDLMEERRVLAENFRSTEEKLREEKLSTNSALAEVEKLQGYTKNVEAELAVVKEQKDLVEMRLGEEKSRIAVLEQQKCDLESQLKECCVSLAKADEDAKQARAELETAKTELRSLYQNQLESVVRSKLTEFQGQLDAAQLAMQAEIDSTKDLAQKRAVEQHNALMNSHMTELKRLESLHKDELRTLELKLAESERRRTKLENNYKEIAQKLHGVMENQWQQALSILTNELSSQTPGADERIRCDRMNWHCKDFSNKPMRGESESSDETPFNKDDLITYRSNDKAAHSGKQEQLLKYIRMLLVKQPRKAGESSTSALDTSFSVDEPQAENPLWPRQLTKASSAVPAEFEPNEAQNKKPPWK